MPVEMGMWRIDGDTPKRLVTATLPSEATLEQYLEKDPSLLGERLLVIGRQVHTPHGKFIDLLAIDGEGNLHVLELKRDKTPRDVVAQVLDYGSWVSTLDRDSIIDIANDHLGDVAFEAAFEEVFGTSAPDELNAALQLTIVATDLDASSERIVTYLRTFGVPVNAVFFSYLEDDGRRYLARSWLAREDESEGPLVAREGGRERDPRHGIREEQEGKASRVERARLVRVLRRVHGRPGLGGRPDVRLRVCRRRCVVLTHAAGPPGSGASQRVHPPAGIRRYRRGDGSGATLRLRPGER